MFPKQKITYPDYGSRVMRILEALTPITGITAPTVNADYLGQLYVDTVAPKVYVAVAVGSETPVNDWVYPGDGADGADGAPGAPGIDNLPLTGEVAPASNATYMGQTYVDTVAKKVYMAVAVDSVTPTDDWKEVTFVSG